MDEKLTQIITFFENFYEKKHDKKSNNKSDKFILLSNLRKILNEIFGINLSVPFLFEDEIFEQKSKEKVDFEPSENAALKNTAINSTNSFSQEKISAPKVYLFEKIFKHGQFFNIVNSSGNSTAKSDYNKENYKNHENNCEKIIDNFLYKSDAEQPINLKSKDFRDNSFFSFINNFFNLIEPENSFFDKNNMTGNQNFSSTQYKEFSLQSIAEPLKSFIEMTDFISIFNDNLDIPLTEYSINQFEKMPDIPQSYLKKIIKEKSSDKNISEVIHEEIPVLQTETHVTNNSPASELNLENMSFENSFALEKHVKEIFVSVMDDFNRLKGFC